MLEAIGLFTVCFVVAIFTFILTLKIGDNRRWWAEAGLAAIIPLGILGLIAALITGGLTFWLLS